MKKIIFTCGIIGGLISVGWYIFSVQVFKLDMSMNARLFFGYASMVLAFSLIFVGIKNFRDNYSGGVISFGTAIKVALLITAVASTVYVGVWLIDYYFFTPDYFDKYAASVLAGLKASHTSQANIDKQMAQITEYAKMYRNPFYNALMTYAEIAPVGIVISLIAALILKNKPKPATVNV
ncbi:MAG TPA: DUF4199 domain-containing protein [Mucilaginibacter sp.]|jgi:hypothetical protein|nr:DUF4199 domain-containing protein [Mucilaginibacter sp.]